MSIRAQLGLSLRHKIFIASLIIAWKDIGTPILEHDLSKVHIAVNRKNEAWTTHFLFL